MALGSLADLIDLTGGSPRASIRLYIEAIACSVSHFRDHHIYPYLYLAGFCFRQRNYSEALFNWKKAAVVLSRYNYNPKEDEEAYKEVQEIASDLIPFALNQLSQSKSGLRPQHYRDLIEFYDGLCGWEQESKWPVLHIGWSKSLVSCLNKFPPSVRTRVSVRAIGSGTETVAEHGGGGGGGWSNTSSISSRSSLVEDHTMDNNENPDQDTATLTGDDDDDGNDDEVASEKRKNKSKNKRKRHEIEEIVRKCSQDPDFLIASAVEESSADHHHHDDDEEITSHEHEDVPIGEESAAAASAVIARVSSEKMVELKDLLVKREGKLNSSAIQLQITAQSSLSTTNPMHHHHHHHGHSSHKTGSGERKAAGGSRSGSRANPAVNLAAAATPSPTAAAAAVGSPLASTGAALSPSVLTSRSGSSASGGGGIRTPSPANPIPGRKRRRSASDRE